MRLIQFLNHTRLDELFMRHRSEGANEIIAHRQNVWLYNYDEEDEVLQDVEQFVGTDDMGYLRERPDVVTGTFDGSTLFLNDLEIGMDPQISTYIKKLAQFLGAHEVEQLQSYYSRSEQEVEFERRYPVYQIGQRVPDEALHGTNTEALPEILRFGLDPQRGTGNWEEDRYGSPVGKFELVFLTVRPASAIFHAEGSAHKRGRGAAPVVLRVKIPDKNLIGPDYDVAMATGLDPDLADHLGFTGSAGWHHQMDQEHITDQQKLVMAKSGQRVWQQTGLFSYRGRIPANHIVGIEADLSGDEGIVDPESMYGSTMYDFGTDIEEFKRAFELYQDHGYWYPDMEAELEELEDEEEDEDY